MEHHLNRQQQSKTMIVNPLIVKMIRVLYLAYTFIAFLTHCRCNYWPSTRGLYSSRRCQCGGGCSAALWNSRWHINTIHYHHFPGNCHRSVSLATVEQSGMRRAYWVFLNHIQHTASTDYSPTASPSSGTISASNTQSTHTFVSFNDTNSEAPETFFVNITITGTTPASLSATADPDRATVQITDNDGKLHYVHYCSCCVCMCVHILPYSSRH